METDDDVQYEWDCSNITDDGYLAGNEDTPHDSMETCLILYCPQSRTGTLPHSSRHRDIFHTKGEDRKPRM